MIRTAAAATVFAIAVGTGCAGSQPSGAIQTQDANGCDAVPTPRSLPPLSSVADTAELRRLISRTTFARGSAQHTLTLVVGRSGHPVAARFRDTSLTVVYADELRQGVLESFRAQPPGDVWGVRFRITTGANPEIEIEQAEMCRPTVIIGSLNTLQQGGYRSRYGITREEARRMMRRSRNYRIAIAIDRTGRVEDVSIIRSLGSLVRDEVAVDEIGWWRFTPLRIDGIPVATVLEMDDLDFMSLIGAVG